MAFGIQFAEEVHHQAFVLFVQVARRFIGKNQNRVIDEGAGDADALLLAAGQFAGEMVRAIGKAHPFQSFEGFFAVRDAVVVLGYHQIFHGCEVRNQVKLLEHHADLIAADLGQLVFGNIIEVDAVQDDFPGGVFIHAADDIHQSGFTGAGRSHDGQPVSFFYIQIDMLQRGHASAIEHAYVG